MTDPNTKKCSRMKRLVDLLTTVIAVVGAQIIADETTSATFCYYCHNPVVLAGRLKGNYKPAYVLPFAVQRDAAEKEFRAWCRKRWFLPSDFQCGIKDQNRS